MSDGHTLLKEFSLFSDYQNYCPSGYCNQFLETFAKMDQEIQLADEYYPQWSRHFAHLAALSAEMFSIVADEHALIAEDALNCPNDQVFVWLITGYAKSMSSKAKTLLQQYTSDEESWVRTLANDLLTIYF